MIQEKPKCAHLQILRMGGLIGDGVHRKARQWARAITLGLWKIFMLFIGSVKLFILCSDSTKGKAWFSLSKGMFRGTSLVFWQPKV